MAFGSPQIPSWFDAQAYLAANPDVAADTGNYGANPWAHYLDYGASEIAAGQRFPGFQGLPTDWRDFAQRVYGAQAPFVIQQLEAIDPNRDWTGALGTVANANSKQSGGLGWQDTSRGSAPMLISQVLQNSGPVYQSQIPQWTAAGHQREGEIQAEQATHGSDGFLGMGDFGNLLAIGGLGLTGFGLAGMGPLAGLAGGAAGAGAGAAGAGIADAMALEAGLAAYTPSYLSGAAAAGAGGIDMAGFMNTAANNPFPGGSMESIFGPSTYTPTTSMFEATNLAAGLPAAGVPATGVSAIDFPGMVKNLAGGGMTAAAANPGFVQSVIDAVSKFGSGAVSAVQNLVNGGGTTSDLMGLIGKIAPGLIGAFASNQQGDAYRDLAQKYMDFGAPSRARFESSFQPGFTMANEPGYQDALDLTTKSFLHKASVAGNPADSPNAWNQTLTDVNRTFAFPALSEYRRVNAGAGGLANMTPAAISAENSAIGADANVWNSLGSSAANVFNPPKTATQTLAELMKEIQGIRT